MVCKIKKFCPNFVSVSHKLGEKNRKTINSGEICAQPIYFKVCLRYQALQLDVPSFLYEAKLKRK